MSTFNRHHNASNPYQGKSKRVLCLCSAGLLRSPTAANVLHKEYGHNTRAAGLDEDHALIPVDDVLIAWADEIVCMSDQHRKRVLFILERTGIRNKVVLNLDIPDQYGFMDEELQQLIIKSYVNA